MTKLERYTLAIEKEWQGKSRTAQEERLLGEWAINGMFRNAMLYVLSRGSLFTLRELLEKSTGLPEPPQFREHALSYGKTRPTEEEQAREFFWRKRFLYELRNNQVFLFLVLSLVDDSGAFYPETLLSRWVPEDSRI